MSDEERQDERQGEDEPKGEDERKGEEQQGEEQPTEEQPAEDAPAPDEQAPAEGAPAPEEAPREPSAEPEQKPDEEAPGAELDPIAIEPDTQLSAEERARLEAEAEERARLEAEATADLPEEPAPAPVKPADLAKDARYHATGKRKSSVARVVVTPGGGAIEVNKRKLEEYFPRAALQTVAKQPLVHTGYEGTVDVRVRVHGGGVAGQATAVRHGIARALTEIDPNLRQELKRRGMLTRDARVKERRKAGLKKARKKPQFSKR